MNDIMNKCWLVWHTFMQDIHLKQQEFTYSAYGPFTWHREIIQKIKEKGDSRYIYQNELDKACF